MANTTDKIPIICTAISDFENAKLMKSEKAPGDNVTGTNDRGPVDKQVKLIKEIQPNVKKIGIIYNSSEINSVVQAKHLKENCQPLGIDVVELTVNSVNDVRRWRKASWAVRWMPFMCPLITLSLLPSPPSWQWPTGKRFRCTAQKWGT